jgi:multicomponent Na+:H+ antiporter subunit D
MRNVPPGLVFVVGALALAAAPRRLRTALVLATPLAAGAVLLVLEHGPGPQFELYGYALQPVRVDRLSLAFGYVFVIAAFLSGVYGLRTMRAGEQAIAYAYAGSALGAVFAGDLVTFFVFWEVKAVASALLVMAPRTRAAGAAGMRYLYVHLTGGTLLLAGILLHLATTGSVAFTGFEPSLAAYLMLAGVAVSAAIPPLHAWLPDAYPEASVAGTVFLSAFTTKAAVYALARGFAGYEILVVLGVAMALYGVVYAVLENDIRRLLGYHIVSQVGYMVAAVGIGTDAAINGATAHAFAHILYKGLLLMGAGAVLAATGRRKLTELGGFAHRMPWIVVLYMIGAFSISSVPLFSGFVSKELVIIAASDDGRYLVVQLLKLASVGTFLHTGLKLPYFAWFGPRKDIDVAPAPRSMYAGMVGLAALNIAIGLYPALLYDLLPAPVVYEPYTAAKVVETVQLLTFTALGFWLLLAKLGGEPTVTLDTDWLYRRFLPAAGSRLAPAGARLASARRVVGRDGARGGLGVLRRVAPIADTGARLLPMWMLGAVVLGTFVLVLGVSILR